MHLSIPRYLGFVVFLFALVVGNSAAGPLQPVHFEESLNPEVRVSGATRGGLLLEAFEQPASLDRLLVRIPAHTRAKQLCLSMITRDGRYQARMEFTLPDTRDEFVELIYPTRFREELIHSEEPYLAVLARAGQKCENAAAVFVPAGWTRPDVLSRLHVVVNAGNIDAFIVIPDMQGRENRFECVRIQSSPTVAFNRLCTIELDETLDLMQGEIRRDDFFGNPMPAIALPIAF